MLAPEPHSNALTSRSRRQPRLDLVDRPVRPPRHVELRDADRVVGPGQAERPMPEPARTRRRLVAQDPDAGEHASRPLGAGGVHPLGRAERVQRHRGSLAVAPPDCTTIEHVNVQSILGVKGSNVVTVRDDISLADAAMTLRDNSVGALVVSNDGHAHRRDHLRAGCRQGARQPRRLRTRAPRLVGDVEGRRHLSRRRCRRVADGVDDRAPDPPPPGGRRRRRTRRRDLHRRRGEGPVRASSRPRTSSSTTTSPKDDERFDLTRSLASLALSVRSSVAERLRRAVL